MLVFKNVFPTFGKAGMLTRSSRLLKKPYVYEDEQF